MKRLALALSLIPGIALAQTLPSPTDADKDLAAHMEQVRTPLVAQLLADQRQIAALQAEVDAANKKLAAAPDGGAKTAAAK